MRMPSHKLSHPNAMELMDALKELNCKRTYHVYISYADSLYVVEDIIHDGEEAWIESRDNRDSNTEAISLDEFTEFLSDLPNDMKISIGAAENIDVSLDMQLTEPCEITGVGFCDICKDVYIFAA